MMVRVKVAIISATVVAAVVFFGYSVPVYYQLAAHQPGPATSAGMTSFPPSSAFFFGAWLALLSFVAVCLNLLDHSSRGGPFFTSKELEWNAYHLTNP